METELNVSTKYLVYREYNYSLQPNEVSTCHDMNYGQVWYPTLVDKLKNFTKAEPLFGT